MKSIYIVLVVAASTCFQVVAMEPVPKKQGWGGWGFQEVAQGMYEAFTTKTPKDAVRIHIWDMAKRRFETIDGIANWNDKIKAFVVSEENMKALQINYPDREFYCNKASFISKVAEYMYYWQYRLVTVVEEKNALENNIIFEPLREETEILIVSDEDDKDKIVEVNLPEQPGSYFHANQNLPLGYWFKTNDNMIYKVIISNHNKITYRSYDIYQRQ